MRRSRVPGRIWACSVTCPPKMIRRVALALLSCQGESDRSLKLTRDGTRLTPDVVFLEEGKSMIRAIRSLRVMPSFLVALALMVFASDRARAIAATEDDADDFPRLVAMADFNRDGIVDTVEA